MRLLWLTVALALGSAGSAYGKDQRVPFVGCQSDGQTGPIDAPQGKGQAPMLPEAVAGQLAWYASNNTGGVLGPRGWRCFEVYGSNGSTLMVSPGGAGKDPFTASFTGPAIQLSVSFADTSGRFEAARIAARLFPNRRAFVESVIREKIEPRSSFVFGPFATDKVRTLNPNYVVYKTPAMMDGVGTMSRLKKGAIEIAGLAWMDKDNNASLLAVRLPQAQQSLELAIVAALAPKSLAAR